MNHNKYIVDDNGFTNVYVSGVRIKAGTPQETSGYSVYWGPGNPFNVSMGTRKNLSENAGEVEGAKMAFKQAARFNGLNKLRMNTSSKSLYDAVTDSMAKWKESNWRNEADGRKIRNCSAYKKLSNAIDNVVVEKRMDIEYKYISARWGNIHQNEADRMATNAAERR